MAKFIYQVTGLISNLPLQYSVLGLPTLVEHQVITVWVELSGRHTCCLLGLPVVQPMWVLAASLLVHPSRCRVEQQTSYASFGMAQDDLLGYHALAFLLTPEG